MFARLGDVLYLAGCGLGLLWMLVLATFVPRSDAPVLFGMFLLLPAMLVWIVGIACVYVLRGNTEIGIFPAMAPRRVAPFLLTPTVLLLGFIGVRDFLGPFVIVALEDTMGHVHPIMIEVNSYLLQGARPVFRVFFRVFDVLSPIFLGPWPCSRCGA
jgi:hypothetical protein